MTILESSTLQLNCTVSGFPLPQITWFRTGQDGRIQERVLADSINTIVEEDMAQSSMSEVSSSLVIQVVNSSHSGLYECMAENNLGSDSSQATVTVYGEDLLCSI